MPGRARATNFFNEALTAPDHTAKSQQRTVPPAFYRLRHGVAGIPLSNGACVALFGVLVRGVGRYMLQFSPHHPSESLHLLGCIATWTEDFYGTLLRACYRASGEVSSSEFTLTGEPGKKILSIPGTGGRGTGLRGKRTGPPGKRYRASGEMIPGFGGNFLAVFPAN